MWNTLEEYVINNYKEFNHGIQIEHVSSINPQLTVPQHRLQLSLLRGWYSNVLKIGKKLPLVLLPRGMILSYYYARTSVSNLKLIFKATATHMRGKKSKRNK